MDIAELGFRVDTRGIGAGTRALDDLDRAGRRVGETGTRSGGAIDRSMRNASGGIGTATGALKAMGGVLAAVGIVNLGRDALAMSRDFDTAMNNTQAKLGATTDEMDRLRDQAKEMGAATVFSASEAAEGMGFLAQAGLDADKIMKAMPVTLDLAAAASIGLGKAADIATNIMGGFGLSVEELPRIADVLAVTSAKANTSVEEMAGAMKRVGPVASGFGVSLEESAAAVGILANNGIKADEAGTGLTRMFTALINPVGEGKKALAALGLSMADFTRTGADGKLQMIGIADSMQILEDKGVDGAQIMKIFGQEAGPKLQALMASGSTAVRDLEQAIQSNGQAAQMAATMMQGLPGALKAMASAWEGLNLAFAEGGASGVVEQLVRAITVGLRGATAFVEEAGKAFDLFVMKIGGLSTLADAGIELKGFHGILQDVIGVIRPLVPYIGEFAVALAAVGGTAAAVGLVGAALGVVASIALSPVALAVGALAGAAVLLRRNWDGISGWWSGLWEGLDGDVGAFVQRLVGSVGRMAGDFATQAGRLAASFATSLGDGIGRVFETIPWPSAAELGRSAARVIVSFADLAVDMTNALVSGISGRTRTLGADIDWPDGREIVAGARALVVAFAQTATEMAEAFVMRLSGGLRLAATRIDWPSLAQLRSTARGLLQGFGTLADEAVAALVSGLSGQAPRMLASVDWPSESEIEQSGRGLISGFAVLAAKGIEALVDGLSAAGRAVLNAIDWPATTELVRSAATLVRGFADTAGVVVGSFAAELAQGLGRAVDDIDWPSANEVAGSAGELISAFVELAYSVGSALFRTLGVAIKTMISDIDWPSVSDIARGAEDLIDGFAELAGTAAGNLINGLSKLVSKLSSEIDWPTAAEIGKGAAKFIVGFGELAVRVVLALVNGIDKAFDTMMKTVDWPSLSDIVSGAVKFVGALRNAAASFAKTFIVEMGDLLSRGIASAFDGLFDFLPGVGDDAAEQAQQVGEQIVDATSEAIEDGTDQVEQAAYYLTGSIKDGTRRAIPLVFEAGEDTVQGYADGIAQNTDAVEDASRTMAEIPEAVTREVTESQSPARALYRVGVDVSDGFALGIEEGGKRVRDAVVLVSRDVVLSFGEIDTALGSQYESLGTSSIAADTFTQSMDTLTGSVGDSTEAVSDNIGEMGKLGDLQARHEDIIRDLNVQIKGSRIELDEGAKAANRYRLGTMSYTDAQADAQFEMKQTAKALVAWRREVESLERDLAGVIGKSLIDGDGVEQSLKNVGTYMRTWARERIAEFASEKIVAYFSVGGGEELAADVDAIKGKIGEVGTAFSEADGVMSGFGAALKAAFGGDEVNHIGSITAAITVMAATIDDTMSNTEIGLRAIGAVVGAYFTGGSTWGAALGSEIGGFVNEGLGTDWEVTHAGSQVGYADGEVYGRDFTRESRERSGWRGTQRRDPVFTELNEALDQNVTQFFDGLVTTVSGQFEGLGLSAADAIFDTFAVAADTFAGDNAAEELTAYLQRSTREAYMHGFAELGPGMQDAISDQISVVYGPLDDLGIAFDEFAQTISRGLPMMRTLGFDLGDTFDQQGASALRLVEAMGGLGPAMQALDYLFNNFLSSQQRATAQIQQSNTSLDRWGQSVTGTSSIIGMTQQPLDRIANAFRFTQIGAKGAADLIDKYTVGVDASTGAVRVNVQAIRDQADSIAGLSDYTAKSAENMHWLADQLEKQGSAVDITRLGLELYAATLDESGLIGRTAADQIKAFVVEVDSTTGAVTLNRSALQVYRENLDMTSAAGIDANTSLNALEQSVGATGLAGITTRAALLQYINAQDMSTEAGRAAAIAAFGQMEAVVALEDNTNRLREVYLTVGTAVRDLNLSLDMSAPASIRATEALVALMGGIDGFRDATSNYYQTFYDEQERNNLSLATAAAQVGAFNDRLGRTGEAAIDTAAEFRTYVEGLDLQTEAGRAQYRQAMLLVDSMGLVASTTADTEKGMATLDQIVAGLPDPLRNAYTEMKADAERAAARIDESSADIELSMFGAGENMRTLGLQALATGTDTERATALNVESATRSAKSNEESAASLDLVATVLVKAFGDVDDQMKLTSLNAERATKATNDTSTALDNAGMALDEYQSTLDLTTQSGSEAAAAIQSTRGALNGVSEASVAVSASAGDAQGAAIAYAQSLDTSSAAGGVAYDAALRFADAVSAAGASGVVADAEVRRYVESLDLSSSAGVAAYDAAMLYVGSLGVAADAQTQLSALIALLPAELQAPFRQILTDAGVLSAQLPPVLAGAYAQMRTDADTLGAQVPPALAAQLQGLAGEAEAAGTLTTRMLAAQLLPMVQVARANGEGAVEQLSQGLLQMADIARNSGDAAAIGMADELQWLAINTGAAANDAVYALDTNLSGLSGGAGQAGQAAMVALAAGLDQMAAQSKAAGNDASVQLSGQLSMLAAIARSGGVGAAEQLSVQLNRLAFIANMAGSAVGGQLGGQLNAMANIAQNAGRQAANGLSSGLGSMINASRTAASYIAQAAQTVTNYSASAQWRYYAMEDLRDAGREGAGFATGLDRVTVPELQTTIHMDEAVLRADVARQYRALGGTATQLPDFAANAVSIGPGSAARGDAGTAQAAMVRELRALRAEVSGLRAEQQTQAQRAEAGRNAIAGNGRRQVDMLDQLDRTTERTGRTIRKSVA